MQTNTLVLQISNYDCLLLSLVQWHQRKLDNKFLTFVINSIYNSITSYLSFRDGGFLYQFFINNYILLLPFGHFDPNIVKFYFFYTSFSNL